MYIILYTVAARSIPRATAAAAAARRLPFHACTKNIHVNRIIKHTHTETDTDTCLHTEKGVKRTPARILTPFFRFFFCCRCSRLLCSSSVDADVGIGTYYILYYYKRFSPRTHIIVMIYIYIYI
jgi:hypothetical protein